MVYTWAADVLKLTEPEIYRRYYVSVPNFRKEKADRLHFPADRAQSVGAWVLWQQMREFYGLPEDAVFNLSHSGDYVLCSASDRTGEKTGCDIETVKEMRIKVAERFYCPWETEYVKSAGGIREQTEAFYRIWVLKESFMKAVRRGMALDTRSFEIRFDEYDRPVLVRQPKAYQETYYYKEFQPADHKVKIAVCSTDPQFADLCLKKIE